MDIKLDPSHRVLTITADVVKNFSPDIAALRKTAAHDNDFPSEDSIDRDNIENRYYFVLYDGINLVGSCRIASTKNSILQQWSKNKFPLLNRDENSHQAELTKTVVSHAYRNKGLYKLIALETLSRLAQLGFAGAVTAIRPDFSQKYFLLELGFVEHEEMVILQDETVKTEAVPLYLREFNLPLFKEKYEEHIRYLKTQCIVVKSDLFNE